MKQTKQQVGRISTYVVAFTTFATAIAAETQCVFTTECFETEACIESEFALNYKVSSCPRVLGPRSVVAQTDFGELRGEEIGNSCGEDVALGNGDDILLSGDGATYLLSVSNGIARLSVHMDGPIAVSYHGRCEAAD